MSEEKIRHIIEVFENDYCEKCSEFNCLEGSMEEIITAMKQLQQEKQELKKQLEEYKQEKQEWINLLDMFKNQQRKFIQYLEDLIKQNETVVEVSKYGLPKNCSKLLIDFYKEILSKYSEIIGDDK